MAYTTRHLADTLRVAAAGALSCTLLLAGTTLTTAPATQPVAAQKDATPAGTPAKVSVDARRFVETAHRLARRNPHRGSCKQFVNAVHAAAGRGYLGGGYESGYRKAGYVRVPVEKAQRGDVLQFLFNDWSSRHGIHSAVLLEPVRHGRARVIDSNWVASNTVGVHTLDVSARLAIPGLKVMTWRWPAKHR